MSKREGYWVDTDPAVQKRHSKFDDIRNELRRAAEIRAMNRDKIDIMTLREVNRFVKHLIKEQKDILDAIEMAEARKKILQMKKEV